MLPQDLPLFDELWNETRGDPEVCIAVVDGPVDVSHRSLSSARLAVVGDRSMNKPLGGRASQHGTHITSLIFGQSDTNIRGIAPLCTGILVPVFFDGADGAAVHCTQAELAWGISKALDQNPRPHIINVSAGQPSPTGMAEPELVDAVRRCIELGVLVVAAAGNGGCPGSDVCNCLHVPGAIRSVLPVGAIDLDGIPLDNSNCGLPYQNSGIVAPGEGIEGAIPDDSSAQQSGTSVAAAVVTGTIALLISVMKKRGRLPDPFLARDAVLLSAIGCKDNPIDDCRRLLAGRLNPPGALVLIDNGDTSMKRMSENNDTNSSSTIPLEPHELGVTVQGEAEQADAADCAIENTIAEDVVTESVSQLSQNSLPRSKQHSSEQVVQSGCGCGGSGSKQIVFAIGQLGIDFGTESRRNSLQNRIEPSTGAGNYLDIGVPANYLRHIFGWKEKVSRGDGGKGKIESVPHKPHHHDLKSVVWTLLQDNIPIYAIQPQGSFSEDSYIELAKFLMEQSGFDSENVDGQLKTTELDIDWTKPLPATERRTEFVAIPGVISGQIRLLTNHVVPVIHPDMAGTAEWNIEELASLVDKQLPKLPGEDSEELVRRILDRFSAEVRNDGLNPEDRAKNHGSTDVFGIILDVFETVKKRYKLEQIEIDDVYITKGVQRHSSSFELYDFNLSLFDPSNIHRAKVIVSVTIDVADVVPSSVGKARVYSGR